LSDTSDWHDLVVTFDSDGLDVLGRAASAAVESLHSVPSAPRSDWTPAALHEMVGSLEICPNDGVNLNTVLEELGSVVWAHGVVPSDPACVAHLHPPTLLPAVVTELTIAATNQSMDSWDQSPAATEVELHLMGWLSNLIGFPSSGSGIMTSGGTASNVLGITLARSWAAKKLGVDVLKTGLPPEAATWRILCSDQAHFSVQRAAAQLGLGRDSVTTVETTSSGAMDVAALDRELDVMARSGLQPIAIVGTAGTTDLGIIDPLGDIAERARRHDAWFHVDAAVAGAFLLSERLAPALSGIELADSVTIDFHKLWWQPFNASALVVRNAERFDLLRVKSNYLDRGDELEGVVNLVGRSLDTSRRFDAAKVVATLRTLGRRALSEMLEQLVDLTHYAGSVVEDHPQLELVAMPTSVMCVFSAPGFSADNLRDVQQRLLARGEMVLGRTMIKDRAALKFTFMNPLSTIPDVDRLVNLVVSELNAL
jgi:L-2,4-diaminobutyrate decarboxylase